MQLLFSARETIATLVKYKCKTFITLTPGLLFNDIEMSGPVFCSLAGIHFTFITKLAKECRALVIYKSYRS